MRLFGHDGEKLIELDSLGVSLKNKEELLLLEEFVAYCIKSWDKRDEDFSHEHFIDFLEFKKKTSTKDIIDIQICKGN